MDFLGAGLIGSGVSALGNIVGTAMANSTNKELAKYNWEQQKEFWHMQNEYNKPINQMARYAEAGLNPNLIYGNGASSAGNASTTPTPQLAHVEPYQLPDLGQTFMQVKQIQLQERLNKAQENELNAKAMYQAAQALHENVKRNRTQFDLDLANETRGFSIDLMRLQRDNLNIQLLENQINYQYLQDTYIYRVAQPAQQVKINEQTLQNAKATYEQIKSTTRLNDANARLASARISEVASHVALMDAQKKGIDLNNELFESTFVQRQQQVTQDLLNAMASGRIKAVEIVAKEHGLDQNIINSLVHEVWNVLDTYVDNNVGKSRYNDFTVDGTKYNRYNRRNGNSINTTLNDDQQAIRKRITEKYRK